MHIIIHSDYLTNPLSDWFSSTVQKGLRIPLQLVMTETMGWGVRTCARIPFGAFVVE